MFIFAMWLSLPVYAADAFGVWRTNLRLSTNACNHMMVVRFEPHRNGEVITVDQIDRHGRSTTSSTILYLDGQERPFEGFGCSGTQSSRRLDSQTVEILRACRSGESKWFVRRLSTDAKEMVLEVTEQQNHSRRFDRRLVLEKQD